MLHTIKQLKRELDSLIISRFANLDNLAGQINEAGNLNEFMLNNKKVIEDFIKGLDRNRNKKIDIGEQSKHYIALNKVTNGIGYY
jgi:hypothetical protein